jgi:hypothetical protein
MAGTAPLKSLNAVTAPGNGVTFDVQKARSDWEVQITTTGAPASFAAHLEGAIDGVTFVTVGSSITATGLTAVTSNTPLTQVRLVLDSLTGGTAPTVTGVIVGDGPAGTSGGGGGAATIADGADQAEGAKADAAATTDTGTFSLIALFKRLLQKFTTQFPAALTGSGNLKVSLAESTASQAVTNANLDAALSTLVPTTDFDTKVGALTETAPATDTASSGLNGRLQRVAQRITSLIALLPSALISNRLDVNLGAAPATVTANATLQTGTAVAGNVGGLTKTVSSVLTRPANTTTYTANDEMTDTGGTIRTLTAMATATGGKGIITHCLLSCSSNGGTKPTYTVYVYDTTSTPQTDNAAFAPSDGVQDTCIGSFTLTTAEVGDATANTGNFTMDSGPIHLPYTTVGSADLYFRVKVTNGYTPGANSDTNTFRFKTQQDAN